MYIERDAAHPCQIVGVPGPQASLARMLMGLRWRDGTALLVCWVTLLAANGE